MYASVPPSSPQNMLLLNPSMLLPPGPVACSFSLMRQSPLNVSPLIIHLPTDELLGCLKCLSTMNRAAMNIPIQVWACLYSSSANIEQKDCFTCIESECLSFQSTVKRFPKVVAPFCFFFLRNKRYTVMVYYSSVLATMYTKQFSSNITILIYKNSGS